MTESPLERARRLLTEAADALVGVVESGTDNDLLSVITMGEGAARRIDRATVGAVAVLQRRGFFVDRGYKSTASALSDLAGWELFEARRRTTCCRAGHLARPPGWHAAAGHAAGHAARHRRRVHCREGEPASRRGDRPRPRVPNRAASDAGAVGRR